MQLLLELHFVGLCIGAIHLHQCIPSLLWWFFILNMHNHGIRHTHRKPIQDFICFFMPSFIGLSLLLRGVFWEKRFCFITSYELPITSPIKKFIILNFHTWKLFLSNFSIVIWERPSAILQGNTQYLLRVYRIRLGFSFLRFIGLGLGLRLNKMDLVYVCMSRILYEIPYYT
jgi:hypothetical protein